MKMRHYLPAMALALAFAACSDDYDDSALWEQVNDNTQRIEALETWQGQMNNNISALQELISTTDYITAVTPVMENGEEIGYTITFLHSDPITIYHGKKGDKGDQGEQGEQGPQGPQGEPGEDGEDGTDGSDGSTPVIGVKADSGVYYWTVNGEWLLDGEGKKIPLTGEDGKDAIAPQVRINPVTNEWETSTDGGTSWVSTDVQATGDSFFKSVDATNPNYVIFTLAGGETFTVSKVKANTVHMATEGGLEQALADAGIDAETATELTITGTLGSADFSYMRKNLNSLNKLDLSGVDITVLPAQAFQAMTFETVVLPEGLKEIKDYAFYGCKSLRTLDIPESVEKLGQWIVWKCDYLETVTLHNGLKTLSNGTFYGCGITSIHIPMTVTQIPTACFSQCKNLERIYLHDGITSIGKSAFNECYMLRSFTAPKSLKVLSSNLFKNCSGLELVTLHSDITEIEESAFYGCSSLYEIMTPSDDSSIDERQLPEALTQIGESAFYGCSSLAAIGLTYTQVTTIGRSAFYGCNNITALDMSPVIETIGDNAFRYISIKECRLPETIKALGADVFVGCDEITSITCLSTAAPTITNTTFPESFKESCSLYYPSGATGYDAWTSYFKKTMGSL